MCLRNRVHVDVALVALGLLPLGGIHAGRSLVGMHPGIRVIDWQTSIEETSHERPWRGAFHGYLTRPIPPGALTNE